MRREEIAVRTVVVDERVLQRERVEAAARRISHAISLTRGPRPPVGAISSMTTTRLCQRSAASTPAVSSGLTVCADTSDTLSPRASNLAASSVPIFRIGP